MSTITDFKCVDDEGNDIPCDAFGNNVALRCPECGHPVLVVARPKQRGSSASKPAVCRQCRAKYWIEIQDANSIQLHRL